MALDYFDDALEDLSAALPSWWAHQDPASELAKLLAALAPFSDAISAAIEGIFADQRLETARDEALRTEWAPLYGAGNEQLPTSTEMLRDYLQQRAAEDGSVQSLENALLALLRRPENDEDTSPVLDAVFPADGSGLVLFQPTIERPYLAFPADGRGVLLDATFPNGIGRLEVTEQFSDHRFVVTVRDFLVFDRPAFARAVDRHRMASQFPATITETSG